MDTINTRDIKAIIGLGNPGRTYQNTRHNIGFKVLDELVDSHVGTGWRVTGEMEVADIDVGGHKILVIKPQTFMNNSGKVAPLLHKKGIKPENILVVHDELEQPFGKLTFKLGGSAKGHNGLRSLITHCGENFARLRFGIGRPDKEDVADYVLNNFTCSARELQDLVNLAVKMIDDIFTLKQ